MLTTKPHALLISGSEARFETEQEEFAAHLKTVCGVVTLQKLATRRSIVDQMKLVLRTAPISSPVLICFSGHGSPIGWETTTKLHVSYADIVSVCKKFPHQILFVTSTCFGQYLAKALIGERESTLTSVLSSWQSDSVTLDSLVNDITKAWGAGLLPEEAVSTEYLATDTGDFEFTTIFRWGAIMDRYFFS